MHKWLNIFFCSHFWMSNEAPDFIDGNEFTCTKCGKKKRMVLS